MPASIQELTLRWLQLVHDLTEENNEQIAYQMVGALVCVDALWTEWYESSKEPAINIIFDNVADLELPNGINVEDDADRSARWEQVKASVHLLEKKYL